MLIEEAQWIKNVLDKHFVVEDFPLLNVGSSTAYFRTKVQPFIDAEIFHPLRKKSYEVIHTDLKKEDGVDLVGDLNDERFQSVLKEKGVKSILCSNLLEHLEDPQKICIAMLEVLPTGGKLIITVPYSFPYHKDPIDTMLRPNLEELNAFFKDTRKIEGEIVQSTAKYLDALKGNNRYLLTMTLRWLAPFYKFNEWKYMVKDLLIARKRYSATCLILEKT